MEFGGLGGSGSPPGRKRGSGGSGGPPDRKKIKPSAPTEAEAEAARAAERAAYEASYVVYVARVIQNGLQTNLRVFLREDPMILVTLRGVAPEFESVVDNAFAVQLGISGQCYTAKLNPASLLRFTLEDILDTIRTFGNQIHFVHITDNNYVTDSASWSRRVVENSDRILENLDTNAMTNGTLMITFNRRYSPSGGAPALRLLMTIVRRLHVEMPVFDLPIRRQLRAGCSQLVELCLRFDTPLADPIFFNQIFPHLEKLCIEVRENGLLPFFFGRNLSITTLRIKINSSLLDFLFMNAMVQLQELFLEHTVFDPPAVLFYNNIPSFQNLQRLKVLILNVMKPDLVEQIMNSLSPAPSLERLRITNDDFMRTIEIVVDKALVSRVIYADEFDRIFLIICNFQQLKQLEIRGTLCNKFVIEKLRGVICRLITAVPIMTDVILDFDSFNIVYGWHEKYVHLFTELEKTLLPQRNRRITLHLNLKGMVHRDTVLYFGRTTYFNVIVRQIKPPRDTDDKFDFMK